MEREVRAGTSGSTLGRGQEESCGWTDGEEGEDKVFWDTSRECKAEMQRERVRT